MASPIPVFAVAASLSAAVARFTARAPVGSAAATASSFGPSGGTYSPTPALRLKACLVLGLVWQIQRAEARRRPWRRFASFPELLQQESGHPRPLQRKLVPQVRRLEPGSWVLPLPGAPPVFRNPKERPSVVGAAGAAPAGPLGPGSSSISLGLSPFIRLSLKICVPILGHLILPA